MQRAIGTASDWDLGLRCCSCNPELPGFFFFCWFKKKVVLLSDGRCCYSSVAASEAIINTAGVFNSHSHLLRCPELAILILSQIEIEIDNWALRIMGQRLSCPHTHSTSALLALFNESKILEKGKWHGPTHHKAAASMQPTPDPFSWPVPLPFPSFPAAAWVVFFFFFFFEFSPPQSP